MAIESRYIEQMPFINYLTPNVIPCADTRSRDEAQYGFLCVRRFNITEFTRVLHELAGRYSICKLQNASILKSI